MRSDALIAKLAMVADLREEDVANLLALRGDVRPINARQDIITEGDRPEEVHLIVEGWGARYKMLPDGSRQIIALLIPGDFCDLHVSELGHMDHSIMALTRCRVAFIPSGKIEELTSRYTNLTKALWWSTLVEAAVMRAWIVNVGRRNAFERIAHLLCEMHARLKTIGLVEGDRFDLPLTQEEIADATALTAVHVNRTLQRLRNEGLITFRGGVLKVLDVRALEDAAGFDPAYLHIERRRSASSRSSSSKSSALPAD